MPSNAIAHPSEPAKTLALLLVGSETIASLLELGVLVVVVVVSVIHRCRFVSFPVADEHLDVFSVFFFQLEDGLLLLEVVRLQSLSNYIFD